MTTLEDKILGEKKHYYCSSSSDGEDEESDDQSEEGPREDIQRVREQSRLNSWEGTSSNTGPKGVLRDWQRFKQLESEKRDEQERERLELIKKLSLTCNPANERQDPELVELMDDDFLLQYQKQRMLEMLSTTSLPKFGNLIDLRSGNDFLEAIDNEHKSVTVIIHIYETDVAACKAMNISLTALSRDYPHVKFCKLIGSVAGMSQRFKVDGVPALLVYKGGQVVGNFVRVSDDLGDEFYEGDVENFLIEHGMIVDRSCVPTLVKAPTDDDDEDTDVSLE